MLFICGIIKTSNNQEDLYMAFDGLVTRAITYELNSLLIDTKIDKIFHPTILQQFF